MTAARTTALALTDMVNGMAWLLCVAARGPVPEGPRVLIVGPRERVAWMLGAEVPTTMSGGYVVAALTPADTVARLHARIKPAVAEQLGRHLERPAEGGEVVILATRDDGQGVVRLRLEELDAIAAHWPPRAGTVSTAVGFRHGGDA